jgi:phage baseplate assembly protein W
MLAQHIVIATDTLRGLALAYFDDASRWPEIATVNHLAGDADLQAVRLRTPPFDTYGGYVTIPIAITDGPNTQDPYLIGLAIVDGDLGWDITTHAYTTVSGQANLVQSLLLALKTELGELTEHPDFGFDIARYAIGAVGGLYSLFLRREVLRVIKSDPRVQDVADLNVIFVSDKRLVTVFATITDVTGGTVKLTGDVEV